MEWIEEENRKLILKALNREPLIFGELLEMKIVSRTSLSSHLKKLLQNGDVQKVYDSQKKRVVYRICSKAVAEIYVESMIWNLGITATHQIVRTKLNLPLESNIKEEIEEYLKGDPKNVSWKELFDFLEEKYPLII